MTRWDITARRTVGYLVAVLALGGSAPPLVAQQPTTKPAPKTRATSATPAVISFTPHWTKGETRSYEQIKSQKVTKKGQLPTQISSTARVDIKVLEAGKTGYVVSWSVGAGAVAGEGGAQEKAHLAGVLKLLDGWVVVLDLDSSGNLLGVRNWKELQPKLAALQEAVLTSPEFKKFPPEKQAQIRTRLEAERKARSREQIEELCTREAKAFFAPIGLSFKGAEPIIYDAQFPNPKGGKPFPANARFDLTRIDPESGRAIVDWKQIINPNIAGKGQGLGESLSRLTKNMGRPPRPGDADAASSISVSDGCRYLMDSRTGWVLDMNHVRVIQNDSGERSEEVLRIRRHDPNRAAGAGSQEKPATRPEPRDEKR